MECALYKLICEFALISPLKKKIYCDEAEFGDESG